jgi:hypothetical protein
MKRKRYSKGLKARVALEAVPEVFGQGQEEAQREAERDGLYLPADW